MPGSISWRKLVQKLRAFGFNGPYAGGRHLLMKRDELKLIIPNLHSKDISKYLVAEILRQADISSEEWDKA